MLTFFFFSALVIAAMTFGAVVFVPLMIIGAVIWLLTLPFRLLFALIGAVIHLAAAVVGAAVSLLLAPFRVLRKAV